MASQTRNPTGDGTFTGTWSGSAGSRFSSVSDHPDSSGSTKLTHGTTAGDCYFTFSAFTVPTGSTITNVQVLYYDEKTGSAGASWGALLRVGGSNRATNDAHNPANAAWTLRTATYTTNPATGTAWTVAQVNGTAGSNNLEGFGLVATDANPTCEVASIQLVVNYAQAFSLVVDTASYDLTGAGAGTVHGYVTSAGTASYDLVAGSTLLLKPTTFVVDAATYDVTGADVGMNKGRLMTADGSVYDLVGADVATLATRLLTAGAATYDVTGAIAGTLRGYLLTVGSDTYVVLGADAALDYAGGGGSPVVVISLPSLRRRRR